MYARIARFEGGDPGAVDEQISEMRSQVEGEVPADAPEEVRTLMETVSRFMQLVLSAFLGIFVIGVVGFSHIDAVHNAAHDYRHSMAFPCH